MKIKEALNIVRESQEYKDFPNFFDHAKTKSPGEIDDDDLKQIGKAEKMVTVKVQNLFMSLMEKATACYEINGRPGCYRLAVEDRVKELIEALFRNGKAILPEYYPFMEKRREVFVPELTRKTTFRGGNND